MKPPADWSPRASAALSLVLVAVVGGVDYLTGHELLFSSIYLLPVGLAAWSVGRAFAVVVALLSVGIWLAGDLAAGADFSRAFVPAWNAAIVLAFYLVVVWLTARLRTVTRDLEVRVQQRTAALTDEIAERERLEREVLDVGERERRRIGRDLHDSLGQHLTGTALAGQVLRQKLAARDVPEADDARRIVGLVEEAIERTRAFARGLDPVEIEGGGLAQGLRELAAKLAALSPIACDFEADEAVEVEDDATAMHVYRIAQEALNNALKHGRATRVRLRLTAPPGRVRLEVRDDGRGLPPPAARGRGMGLRIMAHRATVMGGTFDVRAEPGGGTTVTCEMPNP